MKIKICICLLLSLFCLNAFSQQLQDSLLTELNSRYPQEKIYLQLDKSYYNPGETIWFKAYLLSGNMPTHISNTVYAELVKRHERFVFTLALRFVKKREDAEEVAQDVFVKAFRSLAQFKGESKFSTWLYTITTTSCITFLRKKKLDIHSLDNEKVFATAENIEGGMSANLIEQKSKVNMVNEAIKMLSADDAQVLTLFYKGEQTLEEIAAIMGKEANAVKVQLHRARSRLKDKMEKHFKAEVNDLN
ncbi:MAG: sigma-70 family RNA polymerase sigma factor [Bacteroidota bacterium]